MTKTILKNQLNRIYTIKRIFRKTNPELVFLNNYNSFDQKLLSDLSIKNGSKSISVEHGLFNAIRFRNDIIHTDYYFAWGKITKEKYRLNSNKNKIVIVGNPLFPTQFPRMNNNRSKPKIILATPVAPFLYRQNAHHCWSPEQAESIYYKEFQFFLKILDYLNANRYIVHLQVHPGHDIEAWKILTKDRDITLSQRDILSNLPKFDLVILSNSTIIIEALAFGLDVIIYQSFDQEIINDIYNDFDGKGFVEYCKNISEFESILLNYNNSKQPTLKRKMKEDFIQESIAATGKEALNNISEFIDGIL